MTHREDIVSALRHATRPLDDDELARRAGITPRQTVNQICRRLEAEGVLSRVSGPDGKIVNVVRGTGDRQAPDRRSAVFDESTPNTPPQGELPAGDSSEQRRAERAMLDALGERLGVTLKPRRLERHGGVRVEIDGADEGLTVLVECWAHQGPAKVAQKYKLVNDAVKLHWIASTMQPSPRRILCVSDEAAVQHLRGRSWQGQAIRDLGVEIAVIELPDDVREAVAAAQVRQFR